MKVLLVVHQFYPKYFYGTENYVLKLAQELQKIGIEVAVFSGDPDSESEQPSIYEYNFQGLKVYNIPAGNKINWDLAKTFYRHEFHSQFSDLLTTFDPDIVHFCHLSNLGNGLIGVAKAAEKKVIITLTDFFGVCFRGNMMNCKSASCNGPSRNSENCLADLNLMFNPNRPENALISYLSNYALNTGNYFVGKINDLLFKLENKSWEAISRKLIHKKKQTIEYYNNADKIITATSIVSDVFKKNGLDSRKMIKIHFGIDLPDSTRAKCLSERYTAEKLLSKKIVVGFIGQFFPHKGPDLLIDAFKIIESSKMELHLYAKVDENNSYCRQVIEASEKLTNVHFLGEFSPEEVYQIFNRIDLLVMPSRWHENAPLVLLNCLASKTCVIVSDGKGMTEFVKDGKNGYVFKSKDQLVSILEKIQNNPLILRKIFESSTGYQMSCSQYAKEILNVYSKTIKKQDDSNEKFASFLQYHKNQEQLFKSVHKNKFKNTSSSYLKSTLQWNQPCNLPQEALRLRITGSASIEDFNMFGSDILKEISIKCGIDFRDSKLSILEYGYGCGRLLRQLHPFHSKILFNYEEKNMVEWVVANWTNCVYIDKECGRFQVPDQSVNLIFALFDLIYSSPSLISRNLSEVSRLLKCGGSAFFLSYNVRSLISIISSNSIRRSYNIKLFDSLISLFFIFVPYRLMSLFTAMIRKIKPRYVNFYSQSQIEIIAKRAGLVVDKNIPLQYPCIYQLLEMKKPDDC